MSAGTDITINVDALAIQERLRSMIEEEPELRRSLLIRLALLAQAEATSNAPVNRGELRASIQIDDSGLPDEIVVEATAKHAIFVEEDTRAHIIEARNAQALAFPSSGARRGTRFGTPVGIFTFGGKQTVTGLVFAKRVLHPGTKGQHFMADAADKLRAVMDDIAEEEVAKWLEETGGVA